MFKLNLVNEFSTEGYISCAFPSLFPTGAGDWLAPRVHPITVGYYFRHLLMYGDGQFAKHPRFWYFALNTEMSYRALQTMSTSTQGMQSSHLMTFVTWLAVMVRALPTESSLLQAACVIPTNNGTSKEVVSSP